MNIKQYLPFEEYTITSNLSPDKVMKRLQENVAPGNRAMLSFRNKSDKPYQGKISDDTFVISRIINYRNSFLPLITGHVSTFLGKTQIRIRMRPMKPVIIIMSIWLGIVGLVCIAALFNAILQFKEILHNGVSFFAIIPFAMFVFGCLLPTFGFKAESKNSKAFLSNLFEAQDVKQNYTDI